MIFTPDNLCMDTFIRSYMDEAGFVPIALVCGYPNVAGFGAPYNDIVARIQEVAENSVIEVDIANETIRLKVGWEMVSLICSLNVTMTVCICFIQSYSLFYCL